MEFAVFISTVCCVPE